MIQPITMQLSLSSNRRRQIIECFFPNANDHAEIYKTELDALPIKENTGLPYASKVEQVDADGIKKGIMHACTHNLHMTCLLAVYMHRLLNRLSGLEFKHWLYLL
ncbi:hypothetical protein BDW59DRAFT_144112 [Aspergillus cavernicola]|uniref:Uncharacterized protein n=1 Tax=Aspergillus cavernicola TaxID=176166 RepID=A0ABR4IIQ6_9EURO